LYEWCTDNGSTPFLAVLVDETVRVPNEYVKDGEIVLNISFDATSSLDLGNEFIEFKGRFGGVARDILVPINRVLAIYARENGQGMAFPMLASTEDRPTQDVCADLKPTVLTSVSNISENHPTDLPRPPGGGKPSLTRIK
jgi:stringent starvation protein B